MTPGTRGDTRHMGVALTAVESGCGVALGLVGVQGILAQVQPILKSNARYSTNEYAPHARCVAVGWREGASIGGMNARRECIN